MQQRDDNVLTTNDAIRAMAATVGRLMMQAKTSAEHDAEVETLLASRRRRGDTLRAAQRTFPDWTRFTGRFTGAVELYAIDLELLRNTRPQGGYCASQNQEGYALRRSHVGLTPYSFSFALRRCSSQPHTRTERRYIQTG